MSESYSPNFRPLKRQIGIDESSVVRWKSIERFMSLPPGWRILRSGGFAWLDPTPSFEWYRRFYNEGYLSDAQNPVRPDDPAFEKRRLGYFIRRLERITRHLGRRPQNLLEIGSGDGMFLLAAEKFGVSATGVDVSEQAREDAKSRYGIEFHVGDIVRSDIPLGGDYDVIVMNHVLEHLVEPLDYLERIRGLLRPGGLFVFEIPQQFINPIDVIYRAIGARRPLGVYTLHHPYFYSVSSIRTLMETADFRIERLVTWLPGQVFHVQNRWMNGVLQAVLWLADRLARRGHIIEVFARPK